MFVPHIYYSIHTSTLQGVNINISNWHENCGSFFKNYPPLLAALSTPNPKKTKKKRRPKPPNSSANPPPAREASQELIIKRKIVAWQNLTRKESPPPRRTEGTHSPCKIKPQALARASQPHALPASWTLEGCGQSHL